jgi:hypothetical protein
MWTSNGLMKSRNLSIGMDENILSSSQMFFVAPLSIQRIIHFKGDPKMASPTMNFFL